ncbi:MAG: hypothetical protein KatS3mg085_727 [Candidatus Dojkabacteria bacterium]|nr:MAG: hypothetical protein KatS3mg085_727 [Candidatus Dojkabacteria bacterium]
MFLYVTLRNTLLFFFLISLFQDTIAVRNNTMVDKIFVGLLFGLLMASLPIILKFFKLPVNAGSLILIGVVAAFLFYFVGFYLTEFLTVASNGVVETGIESLDFRMEDRTVAFMVLSVVSATLSMIMETLSQSK